MPDGCSGGNAGVTISRSQAHPAYTRANSVNVSRPNPVITPVQGMFTLNGICPNSIYTYQIQNICGASNIQWSFPPGWIIQNGQGTNLVSVATAGRNPQSGTINITVSFSAVCCSNISKSFQVTVLNEPPPPPYVYNGEFPPYGNNFYCGEYQVCQSTGTSIGPVNFDIYAVSMTWTVSSPWHFQNGLTQITTSPAYMSPPVFGPSSPPLNGQMCVTQTNCVGISQPTCVSFRRAIWNEWCDLSNNYPEWCECCEPVCPTCPPYPLMTAPEINIQAMEPAYKHVGASSFEITSQLAGGTWTNNPFTLTPNPTENSSRLYISEDIEDIFVHYVNIYNISGQHLKTASFPKYESVLELDYPLSPGIYIIQVMTNQGKHYIKWMRF